MNRTNSPAVLSLSTFPGSIATVPFPIHWSTEAVLHCKQTRRGACRGFQQLRQHFSIVLTCKQRPVSECSTRSPFFSHWMRGSGLPLAMQDIVCSLPRSFSALLMCSTHSGKAAEGQNQKCSGVVGWGGNFSLEDGQIEPHRCFSREEGCKRLLFSPGTPGSTHSPKTWTCELWANCLSLCDPIIN